MSKKKPPIQFRIIATSQIFCSDSIVRKRNVVAHLKRIKSCYIRSIEHFSDFNSDHLSVEIIQLDAQNGQTSINKSERFTGFQMGSKAKKKRQVGTPPGYEGTLF